MDGWIVIPNWDKFQHYKDRNPTWIKLYLELSGRIEWRNLSFAERGLLTTIWVEYCRFGCQLPLGKLATITGQRVWKRHLDSLIHAGLIEVSASKPLAHVYTREEKRREESPKGSYSKTVDNSDAQRRKVKAWVDNVLPHLEGVDLAYTIADEFKIEDQDLLADLIAYAQERMLAR